jgi:hypothetical protein
MDWRLQSAFTWFETARRSASSGSRRLLEILLKALADRFAEALADGLTS